MKPLTTSHFAKPKKENRVIDTEIYLYIRL